MYKYNIALVYGAKPFLVTERFTYAQATEAVNKNRAESSFHSCSHVNTVRNPVSGDKLTGWPLALGDADGRKKPSKEYGHFLTF